MKKTIKAIGAICVLFFFSSGANSKVLNVVTTLPDYAVIAKAIGGERVKVSNIVRGDQDAHFIRPKPSFANMVRNADVLIDTGLDLEMWLPSVINTSRNRKVRSGRPGYVSASYGMKLLEKPQQLSHSEGGLHIYGNPHFTSDPLLMKIASKNIMNGLIKNDPKGKSVYQKNWAVFEAEIDRRFFGETLVKIIGGERLCALAEEGKLFPFLEREEYKGKKLTAYLGGWAKKMLPLYGAKIVTYHRNWVYFFNIFGLKDAGTIEPKPGIPPSVRHVAELVTSMKADNVKIILAANYFSRKEVENIAEKVGARAVIVPIYVDGAPGVENYFKLVDCWVDSLTGAAAQAGIIK
jgi:zinc/manganese transport system substrate-binding protein